MDNLAEIRIDILDDKFVVDSRSVAINFKKRHDNVLRDIENIRKDVLNFEEMFIESYIPDSYGRQQRIYLMNRDGFLLLAMGFTGKEALSWKLKYIEAFNKMEKAWNTPEQIMARALKMASQSIESLKDRCKFLGDQVIEQQQIITELQPKANYVDKILQSKSLVTITQIAKDYGMSGRKFNQILKELKIQYKVGGQWVLYSKYQNNGYVHSRTIDITRTDGRPDVAMQTEWSQKGRLFLYEELKKHGYVPVIEQAA